MYLSDSFVYAYGIIEHMSEDEIKHEQDTPVDVPSDGSDASSETPPPPPEFPYNPAKLPIVPPKSTSRRGLIILIVLLGLLSLGGGSAFAYYMLQGSKPKPAVANVATPTPLPTPKPLVADAVLYATSVPGKNVGSCATSTSTLYRQPLSGTKATKVFDAPDYQLIAEQDSYRDQVIISTVGACGSKAGQQIWYSADSGNSFSKLYETPAKDDAITSIKFASDGKTIAFGYLANGSKEAVLKELNVATKKSKDLLTASNPGIYIRGFDQANGKIYYVEGCYGCDPAADSVLSVYGMQKNTIATLYDEDNYSYSVQFNMNYSKGIKVHAISPTTFNANGTGYVDYVIDEFDTTSGTATALTTSELKNVPLVSILAGYLDDGTVYYVKGKDMNILGKDKKSTVLLTSDNTINTIYTASKDTVIYKNSHTNDGAEKAKTDVYTDRVILYDVKTKKSTQIVAFKDYQSTILGITWK